MFGKVASIAAICLGIAIVAGEVVYVQYISGHTIKTARVFEPEIRSGDLTLALDESDLPLRVVVTATGARDRADRLGRPHAEINFKLGADGKVQPLKLTFSSEHEIPFSGRVTHTQSFLIDAPYVGEMPVHVSLGPYHQFKISEVEATFRGGGRGLSLVILAIGALSFGSGVFAFSRSRAAS